MSRVIMRRIRVGVQVAKRRNHAEQDIPLGYLKGVTR